MSSARGYGVYQPRSRKSQVRDVVAGVRDWFSHLMREAVRRTIGFALLILSLGMLAVLATYDSADPGFNNATSREATNWLGSFGAYMADWLLQGVGVAALALIVPLAAWGWRMAGGAPVRALMSRAAALVIGTLFLAVAFGALPPVGALSAGPGGIVGALVAGLTRQVGVAYGTWITFLVPVVFGAFGAVLIFQAAGLRFERVVAAGRTAGRWLSGVGTLIGNIPIGRARDDDDEFEADREAEYDEDGDIEDAQPSRREPTLAAIPEPLVPSAAQAPRVRVQHAREKKVKPKSDRQPALNLAEGEYQLPPLGLLTEPPAEHTTPAFSDEALEENARLLETVLSDFGVRGRITAVRPGPVVTLYELEPAAGVKSSRVIALSDDIARSMSAVAARVAVIPGRNVIGIELPNLKRETVYLRELFSTAEYEKSRAPLTLALGKTIGGEPVMADLAKMPHLLIAGTTGSGKSVALNTMILSLPYRMPPSQCRMILIDPKMLELSVYDAIPHLLSPVVIDPKKAVVALKWAVKEMEARYGKMAKIGVRGVEAFNERVRKARDKGDTLKRTVQTGFDRDTGQPIYEDEVLELEPMPYIVVVVDEMADLMMISGKEIEGAVQRLAQMARAAGIHLIAATQRPSVDVITGTIKANFPTRISFQVTSKIDSRTILGEQGAEQLLGQGDMLYMMAGGRIRRVHGPFVTDSEVEDVVGFLKSQGRPEYLDAVTEDPEEDEEDPYNLFGGEGEGGDDLFDKAVAIAARERKCSVSYIQRRLQIGYNRAARIVERMEQEGMVSKPNHKGLREVLLPEGPER
jgi:S-DNA-T family DNA segregation ATPase FtsK/SpoIIIE